VKINFKASLVWNALQPLIGFPARLMSRPMSWFWSAIIIRHDIILILISLLSLAVVSELLRQTAAEWRWVYWFSCLVVTLFAVGWHGVFASKFKPYIAKLRARRCFRLAGVLSGWFVFLKIVYSFDKLGFLGVASSFLIVEQFMILLIAAGFVCFAFKKEFFVDVRSRPLVSVSVLSVILGVAFGLAEFRAFT